MLSSRWTCTRCLSQFSRVVSRPSPPSVVLSRFVRNQSTASSSQSHTSDNAISPILLSRARSLAAEHAQLSAQNATSYDINTAKKIGELNHITSALRQWEEAQNSLSELESLINDPTSDADLRSLAQADIESTTSTLPSLSSKLKTSLIPAHPFASLACLIEIHPGAGGSEASLFAHELLQMYISFCTRLNLPYSLASYTSDDSAPSGTEAITDAILEINSPGSYDTLRTEAGVHRVQRVPATEKKGRTHTSAVSVLVLPLFPESSNDNNNSSTTTIDYSDPTSDYYISPNDVRSETMRARGAGGQHVNKTDSAIRLTHLPTGTVVAMQDSRSQHKNREKAWQVLRAKLAQKRREERENELIAFRRKVMGGVGRTGREDKVRTYNFSQNRVTDHRSGVERADLEGVLAGNDGLVKIMESVREWLDQEEVRALVVEEEINSLNSAADNNNNANGEKSSNGKR